MTTFLIKSVVLRMKQWTTVRVLHLGAMVCHLQGHSCNSLRGRDICRATWEAKRADAPRCTPLSWFCVSMFSFITHRDAESVDSGWEGAGSGATFNFGQGMGELDADDAEGKVDTHHAENLTPTTQTYAGEQLMQGTHPTKSPAERRVTPDERMAQSWPPRTPGPSLSMDETPATETPTGFTLDPGSDKAAPLIPSLAYNKPPGIPRAPVPPKKAPRQQTGSSQVWANFFFIGVL